MSRANPDETPTKNRYQRDARLARTVSPLSGGEGAYCLAKGTVPAGVVEPIYDERESVYVPKGPALSSSASRIEVAIFRAILGPNRTCPS